MQKLKKAYIPVGLRLFK